MTGKKRALAGSASAYVFVAALAGGWLAHSGAMAQSTGSTTVQELVVTGAKSHSLDGLVTTQEAPKTREIVSQAFISHQAAGANALSDLNLIPGVNFTNDDPYGMSGGGGHFVVRGLTGSSATVAEMVDGVPLNDAGNYAIYAGELVDPEVISNVSVITGQPDVDSPTSSSLAGQVNINTLTPSDHFGGFISLSGGSYNYHRVAGLINLGEIGPWGTKAWIEGSDQRNDKYTHVGDDQKWQLNGKIYQDLHHDGDFIAVAGFYDRQIADLYYGDDFASYTTSGKNANPVAAGDNFGGLLSVPWNSDYNKNPASTNFYGLHQNPTYTGNLRGESRFTLLPNLKLTVDPSYQWVLANGGGATSVSGTDPRLAGTGLTNSKSNLPTCYNTAGVVTGVDLTGATSGGAPVCTGSAILLSPSNTQTDRFTVNTSLIWDINPDQLVRFAYAYDHATVRQTGEYGLVTDGFPDNVFGGLQGYGAPIIAADGTIFQKRNRLTVAELNQVSLEYIGKFFDDRLRLDLGVRDPMFERHLNQYCYTSPPSSVYCTSQQSIAVAKGYPVLPFDISTSYSKALPNVGLTWNFDQTNSVFLDYSQALNAPVNDDLYAIATVGHGSTTFSVGRDVVQPETSATVEVGYRYQTPKLTGTLDAYEIDDDNHIVSSYNQTTGDTLDQNVGTVRFYGVEGLVGAAPIEGLNLTGSFAYNHSELLNNIPWTSTYTLPSKGKAAIDAPELTFAGRAEYTIAGFTFGLDGKWVDKRYVTYVNDLSVPSYVVFDADVRWDLGFVRPGTFVQINAINIFNEKYLGSINPEPTNNSASPAYTQGYAYQGAPTVVQITLRAAF